MLRDCAKLATLMVAFFYSISVFAYSGDPLEKETFGYRVPSANDLDSSVVLWATSYYLPQIKEGNGDIALRDMKNMSLGPELTLKEWCEAALEGSVRILSSDGSAKTFNYAGTTAGYTVDCSSIFRFDVSRTKFREAVGPYGDGIKDFILVPYRTIATDMITVPTGTVLYIPQARGAKIVLENGRTIIHDGYFFAADRGGAIKNNHIDVFIGTHTDSPFFPWIKSRKEGTFTAFVVTDKTIISELTNLHKGN
jgi:3D (Asp-Asp-Asp) domain-containing protein